MVPRSKKVLGSNPFACFLWLPLGALAYLPQSENLHLGDKGSGKFRLFIYGLLALQWAGKLTKAFCFITTYSE